MTKFSEAVAEAESRSAIRGPRAISRAAKAKGFTLSHGTAAKVLNGTHGNVSDQTVRAIAAVLPVSEAKLYEALGVSGAGPYQAPPAADRLTAVQRDLINALIHQIVRPDESAVAAQQSSTGGEGVLQIVPDLKASEVDESLSTAALETEHGLDEEPGGSEPNE